MLMLKISGGKAVLIHAANEGHIEVVKILIAAGADVDTRDKCGQTALNYAQEPKVVENRSNIEIIELLEKAIKK